MTHDLVPARSAVWSILEYRGRADLAPLLQQIHDLRLTGRVMIHVGQGTVQSVEWCEVVERVTAGEAPIKYFEKKT